MAGGRAKWYGDQQARGLEASLFRGLKKAAAYGRTSIVRAISKSARAGGGGRRRPGKGKRKGRPMQFKRSRPGQPPRRDTGKLAQSIFWSADRQMLAATVGTKLKYGVYLEKGAVIPSRSPKRKKYMVWGAKEGGGVGRDIRGRFKAGKGWWVFAKEAKGFHLAPRPYIESTLVSKKRRIEILVFSEARAFSARGGVRFG